jgi:hypothetical protein
MRRHFFRFADTNGDGTGNKSGAIDGSVTPVQLKLAPRAGESLLLVHFGIVHIVDTGSFDSGAYGNALALSNGITIGIYDVETDALLADFLDGEPIITNADWGHSASNINLYTFGSGPQVLIAKCEFGQIAPIPISTDEYLAITINDDLTGLDEHDFKFCGMVE